MNKRQRLIIAALGGLLIVFLASGCHISLGGGTQHHRHEYFQTTRGQELLDLEKAREEGAVSECEYRAQRRKILEK